MSREESNGSAVKSYVLQPANQAAEETARLDELHAGIAEYFGQRLSLAPLEDVHPSAILELGSGSGAWAIQAANEFPAAQVLAVDISPIPQRHLPPNLEFRKLDLTQPLPFKNGSFDIVHARLVMMHGKLPNTEDVLKRCFELVKPGGWMLVEDPDDDNMVDGDRPLGPGMSRVVKTWLNILRSRGAEPSIGRDLQRILTSSGCFSQVNVRKVPIPLSQKSRDPAENKLGLAWKVTMKRIVGDLPTRFAEQGITHEVVQKHFEELDDPNRNITTDMYFSWSQKKD